jgi:carbamate kinase
LLKKQTEKSVITLKRIVIALGGNALQDAGAPATAEAQLAAVSVAAKHIANIVEASYCVILGHGNGPQVGRLVLQNEYAVSITPAMPFDVCGAMSQGMIGYHIQQGLAKELRARGNDTGVVTVVTQVVVDENDPGFQHPTKPIGAFYTEEEANDLREKSGYVMVEDAGRGYRRVIASPLPLEIVEIEAVRRLVDNGFIPITVGGGGIPVIRNEQGDLEGVAAVIDKDFASEKLAEDIDADILLILTAVEKVYLNYGQPNQKELSAITASEAEEYCQQGHFAPGSMLPKVKAAIKFTRSKQGRQTIITSLDKALDALEGKTGTIIK